MAVKGHPPATCRYIGSVLSFLCYVEGKMSYRYALICAIRIRKLVIMGSRKNYIYGPQ